MFKKSIKISYLSLIISLVNLLLFHIPFFKFVLKNTDASSLSGILLIISLIVLAIFLNALVFYILLNLLQVIGKWIIAIFFILNAIAIYFINTYGIIVDRSMMGNVFNTNFDESSSFFSFTLIIYIIAFGIIPSVLLFKFEIERSKPKKFILHTLIILVFLLSLVYANATNWLWIDNNSKTLGALVLPWSYVVNTSRYFHKINQENQKQLLLPNATIKNNEKAIVVLVIGESARSKNFSLYGYNKNTNPLLSKIENLNCFKAESCATYTTAGIKCILEHQASSDLYETLPNYLYRNNIEVIWRTTNWGEPKVNIKNYVNKAELEQLCNSSNCEFDEVLLYNLNEQIISSSKNKILVILHTSTSHGPTYHKKYPERFRTFTPECKNVELSKCTNQELINSYDNTIVYTDYLLASLIEQLKELKDYKSSMIFVSDHGESLGENNLYMHGLPKSIAPKEQFDIPFIVWTSENSRTVKNVKIAEQHQVFHSVLDFLSIESPVYDENMSLFRKK